MTGDAWIERTKKSKHLQTTMNKTKRYAKDLSKFRLGSSKRSGLETKISRASQGWHAWRSCAVRIGWNRGQSRKSRGFSNDSNFRGVIRISRGGATSGKAVFLSGIEQVASIRRLYFPVTLVTLQWMPGHGYIGFILSRPFGKFGGVLLT